MSTPGAAATERGGKGYTHHNYNGSPVDKLLPLLSGVRQTGAGRWIARSPCREDRTPSLSIRELNDGRILLNDFGGASAAEVLAAVGLTLADLFPATERQHHQAPTRNRVPAPDILKIIDKEAAIVAIAAADIGNGFDLSDEDLARVQVAAERIADARRLYEH